MSKQTRYIGAQIDKELHKKIKMKCAERDLTVHKAVVLGLIMLLDLDEDIDLDEINEELSATGS